MSTSDNHGAIVLEIGPWITCFGQLTSKVYPLMGWSINTLFLHQIAYLNITIFWFNCS